MLVATCPSGRSHVLTSHRAGDHARLLHFLGSRLGGPSRSSLKGDCCDRRTARCPSGHCRWQATCRLVVPCRRKKAKSHENSFRGQSPHSAGARKRVSMRWVGNRVQARHTSPVGEQLERTACGRRCRKKPAGGQPLGRSAGHGACHLPWDAAATEGTVPAGNCDGRRATGLCRQMRRDAGIVRVFARSRPTQRFRSGEGAGRLAGPASSSATLLGCDGKSQIANPEALTSNRGDWI